MLRTRLRAALSAAMRARDATSVAALRSSLGAIDNAEAVESGSASLSGRPAGVIAGAVSGLGAGEVERRQLTEAEMEAVVGREVAERLEAAAEYEGLGQPEAAARLRAEAEVLRAQLP
ncbi:MAG TPA: hypothetical protein VFA11_02850 [Acidimicrobiales bacterium]|nr:hypothetical protein [Acidimicrobiales bacterium]